MNNEDEILRVYIHHV